MKPPPPPVGVELFHPNAQTDRHDEANSLFTKFCERAYILQTLLSPVNTYLEYVIEQLINQLVYIVHVPG